jgi:hypothetical protein
MQMANAGVACGLLSIPLRYMHTPGEVVDLAVVEQSVELLVTFARRVKKSQKYAWYATAPGSIRRPPTGGLSVFKRPRPGLRGVPTASAI